LDIKGNGDLSVLIKAYENMRHTLVLDKLLTTNAIVAMGEVEIDLATAHHQSNSE
jgi:hypothetical protein